MGIASPVPSPTRPPPAVEFFWFDGILEGRRGDDAGLRAAVDRLERIGLLHLTLALDGGRFSLLAADRSLPGRMWSAAAIDEVSQALDGIATAAASGRIESTLRCTTVGADSVRETLWAVQAGVMVPVSRERPVAAEDLQRAPAAVTPASGLDNVPRRRALLLAVLLLVGFSALAWQGGYVDAVLTPRPEHLAVDTGALTGLLAARVDRAWGQYQVEITRGPRFPTGRTQLEALLAATDGLAQRAAIQAVANGDVVYVRLEDEQNRVLETARAELRPLLAAADGQVRVRLPGRISAARVRLALDSGQRR